MIINFSNVEETEKTFNLLEEGMYILKITQCESKTSSKGNEFWSVTYETKDGDKIFDNVFFTEKCLNRVKKLFRCLGLDVDSNTDVNYEPEDLIGTYMNAYILIENYTDKNGLEKQKNVINLWQCEPYTAKKVTKKKVEDLPF